jgi:hypothetical protein
MARDTQPHHWLDGAGVGAAAAAAPIARLAVTTGHGPLVTSQLHTASRGRVWMVSSRRSVHVRVMRRSPQVGISLRSGRRSVVLSGPAEILAPWGPAESLRLGLEARAATEALLGYTIRHSTRMAGYAAEMLRIPPRQEMLPFDRVLIAVTPQRGFVATGTAVTHVHGEWAGDPGAALPHVSWEQPPAVEPGLPDGIPSWVASIVDGRQACTVGWETLEGPLALPAIWDPPSWRAELAPDVAALVTPGTISAPACIALDRSVALRPSAYTGLVLRGTGRLENPRGQKGPVRVALAIDRVSWWSGFDKGTVLA